jgi:serralysin
VNFVYEPHDDGVLHPSSNGALGVRGDIRLAGFNVDGPSGTLAFTYVPSGGSDMAIDTSESSLFTSGANLNHVYFRDTLMHEIGHTFGLEHVSTNEAATGKLLMEPFIDDSANPIDGPQLDEVRGVQFFFGDANEKSNGGLGNGTPARATSLGALTSGSTRLVGASADVPTQAISPTATDFVSISNTRDVDFYSFSVSAASTLSALLTPRGGVFSQGSADQNQTPTTFDANSRSNLALTILAANGTTVLAMANANPAGIAESIANLALPAAGTYYAEVTGADDTIQLYELGLTATTIATLLPGDYNHDGVVDAADYTLWRSTLGQSVTAGTGADGNGDGLITAADFDLWRAHFGQTAASGSVLAGTSVPEPPAAFLVCVGLMTLSFRRFGGRA